MKESIKMEDYDGFLENSTKVHKTKILPLRWFANLCEIPAHYHLGRFLRCDDLNLRGFMYRYHAYMSNLFYKPYLKWGTVYRLDLDNMIKDLKNDPVLDKLGSDYDEDGVAYWEKVTDIDSLES